MAAKKVKVEDRTSYDPYAPPPVTERVPDPDPRDNLVTIDELKLAPRISVKGDHVALTEVNETSLRDANEHLRVAVHPPVEVDPPKTLRYTDPVIADRDGPEVIGEEAPDGTVDEVLEWVGDDANRAQSALEAEEKRDKPRSTLLDALKGIVD